MSFCPHCHSGVDPVLKDTTWSCGVRFNDALWRTKECYKRQIYVGDEHLRLQEQHISELEEENGRLKQRIKRLEEFVDQLTNPKFTRDDLPKEALLQRIKRLEEAGQRVEDAAYSVQDWSGTALGDALDELNKAKEAKP